MDAIRSDNGVGGCRPGTSGHLEQCAGDGKLHRNSSRPGWITGALRVLGGVTRGAAAERGQAADKQEKLPWPPGNGLSVNDLRLGQMAR